MLQWRRAILALTFISAGLVTFPAHATTELTRDHHRAPYDIATNSSGGSEQYDDAYGEKSVVADFNGDGLDDIVVGSPKADLNNSNEEAGLVYVYLGHSSMMRLNLTITGEADPTNAGFHFGSEVAVLDDVSGDSLPDLVIGSENYSSGSELFNGRAYIVTSQTLNAAVDDAEVIVQSDYDSTTTAAVTDLASVIFEGEALNYVDATVKKYETTTGNTYYVWWSDLAGDDGSGEIYFFTPEKLAALVTEHPSTPQYFAQEANVRMVNASDGDSFTGVYPWTGSGYLLVGDYVNDFNSGRVWVLKDSTIDELVALDSLAYKIISSYDEFAITGDASSYLGLDLTFVGTNSQDDLYAVMTAPYSSTHQGAVYAISKEYVDTYISGENASTIPAENLPFVAHGEGQNQYFGLGLAALNNGTVSQVVVGEPTRALATSSHDDFLVVAAPYYPDPENAENTVGKVYVITADTLGNTTDCQPVTDCDANAIIGEAGYHAGFAEMRLMNQDYDGDNLGELFMGDTGSTVSDGRGAIYMYNSSRLTTGTDIMASDYDGILESVDESDNNFGSNFMMGHFNKSSDADYTDVDVVVGTPRFTYDTDTTAWGALEVIFDVEDAFGLRENYLAVGMKAGKYAVYEVEDDGTLVDKKYESTIDTKLPVQVAMGYFHSPLYYETLAVPMAKDPTQCHNVFFSKVDTGKKEGDKTWKKLCHPEGGESAVDISSGDVDNDGLDELVVVFPRLNGEGAIVQVYEYKKNRWQVLTTLTLKKDSYGNGASVAVGYLGTASKEYVALTPNDGHEVILYQFQNKKLRKVNKVKIKKATKGVILSIDSEDRILYAAKRQGNGTVLAYTIQSGKLAAKTDYNFEIGTKPTAFTAMDTIVAAVKASDQKTIFHYLAGNQKQKYSLASTIADLAGSKRQENNTQVVVGF